MKNLYWITIYCIPSDTLIQNNTCRLIAESKNEYFQESDLKCKNDTEAVESLTQSKMFR